MYKILFVIILFLTTNYSFAQENSEYKLAADDKISVFVFNEPDLTVEEVRISTSGTISMPLLGQINVQGKTVSEVEVIIHDLYKGDFLKKPDISVTVMEYRQFYVDGEVAKPGGYSYRDGMNVQRAIALAGGFTERAARDKITIIRENTANKTNPVKMKDRVMPGDVITVDESFF